MTIYGTHEHIDKLDRYFDHLDTLWPVLDASEYGLCFHCSDIVTTEPDTENGQCENCGHRSIWGHDNLVVIHSLTQQATS